VARSTITTKGQITLPKAVREVLGVGPGDRVAFLIRDDGTVTVEAEAVDLRTLRGVLKPAAHGVTVDDMNATIRRAGSKR
jgi:AbrB family looped-hinge helix DNA binding protein